MDQYQSRGDCWRVTDKLEADQFHFLFQGTQEKQSPASVVELRSCDWDLANENVNGDILLSHHCYLLPTCICHSVVPDSFVTPCTIAHQAPLSTGFPRQEYWSGQLFPSKRHLPNPGIKPGSTAWQEDSLPSEPRDLFAKWCPALCNPMDCSTLASLSFTVSWSLLKCRSFESVMLSTHYPLSPPLL